MRIIIITILAVIACHAHAQVPGSASIRIRCGVVSPQAPLYIINGEVADSTTIRMLQPGDIAEITILKSDKASAIFGCRAAAGVIIITLHLKPEFVTGKLNARNVDSSTSGITVFPNPAIAGNNIYVKVAGKASLLSVSNFNGQIITSRNIGSDAGSEQLQLPPLTPRGIYIVSAFDTQHRKISSQKIIVK